MTEEQVQAISRTTAWLRDYGDTKPREFVDDLRVLMEMAKESQKKPKGWLQRLVVAVGGCISDQRNGMDVLASASWDRVCEVWCEAENRSDA